MVEAAGVEPASERTSSQDSTCVSASCVSRPPCGSGEVPSGASPGKSRPRAPWRHARASLFNGVLAPTTRRGQARRSQRFRLRERTDCPQLTDFPPDLRVSGARHASHDSAPPSKPGRPHVERRALEPITHAQPFFDSSTLHTVTEARLWRGVPPPAARSRWRDCPVFLDPARKGPDNAERVSSRYVGHRTPVGIRGIFADGPRTPSRVDVRNFAPVRDCHVAGRPISARLR